MRDEFRRCGLCSAPLPRRSGPGPGPRWCSARCRQAAYRMRAAARRDRSGFPPGLGAARREMAAAASALEAAVRTARAAVNRGDLRPGGHGAAVAGLAALARELEARAVAADRAAGASWARAGAPLGLSADGARKRFGGAAGPAPGR